MIFIFVFNIVMGYFKMNIQIYYFLGYIIHLIMQFVQIMMMSVYKVISN